MAIHKCIPIKLEKEMLLSAEKGFQSQLAACKHHMRTSRVSLSFVDVKQTTTQALVNIYTARLEVEVVVPAVLCGQDSHQKFKYFLL